MRLFPLLVRFAVGLMTKRPQWSIIPIFILVAASALAWSSPACAEETVLKEFTVAGHGVLEFNAPGSWKMAIRPAQKDLPSTVKFTPAAGREFLFMISPMAGPAGDKAFNSMERMKQLMEAEKKHLAPRAEEPALMIDSFGGPQAKGLFLVASDKAPRPGEYKYLIRSCVAVGDLMLSVTFLSHRKESEAMEDALALLRGVKIRPQ